MSISKNDSRAAKARATILANKGSICRNSTKQKSKTWQKNKAAIWATEYGNIYDLPTTVFLEKVQFLLRL